MADINQHSPPRKLDDWKSLIARWAIQQSFPATMLIAQTGVIVYLGWYGIDKVVPKHLESIQAGYEKQEAVHERVVRDLIKSFEREREIYRELFMKQAAEHGQHKDPNKDQFGSFKPS